MYLYYPDNGPWSFLVQRLIDEAVQDGVDVNECFRALARIPDKDFEAWYREWRRSAEKIEGLAQKAVQKGHPVTAKEAYIHAQAYATMFDWLADQLNEAHSH